MLVYSAAITRYQSPLRHQRVQHITLRQSPIDGRTVEWQFYFKDYKLYIVTILECRVFILLFIFPEFCGWRCGMFMIEFSLTEMVLISPNITAIISHNVTSIDQKTVNWNWFPFKIQGVFIVIILEVRVFILLFVLP